MDRKDPQSCNHLIRLEIKKPRSARKASSIAARNLLGLSLYRGCPWNLNITGKELILPPSWELSFFYESASFSIHWACYWRCNLNVESDRVNPFFVVLRSDYNLFPETRWQKSHASCPSPDAADTCCAWRTTNGTCRGIEKQPNRR